ncbi:2458_t:CDS:2, partial [Racocetra fulgida]
MYAVSHLYDSVNHKAGYSRRNSGTRPVPQIPSSSSSKEDRKKIGLAAQNAINLENALILLTPNTNLEKDPEIQKLVRKCKDSSEQFFKIIPTVMDDDKMGPLLQSNDQVQAALSKYSEYCESFSQNSNSKNISSEIKQKKITSQSQDSAK